MLRGSSLGLAGRRKIPSGWVTGGDFLEKRKERGRILKMSGVFLPDAVIIAEGVGELLYNLQRNYEKIVNAAISGGGPDIHCAGCRSKKICGGDPAGRDEQR